MGWESLQLLFAEDLSVTSITSRDFWVVGSLFRGLYRNLAYKVAVVPDGSRSVDASGDEFCSFCVRTSEYDREMGVVNPSAFPLYFGLYCCKPWIAEDGFMLAEIREKELQWDGS